MPPETLVGLLGKARVAMQIDVGFGDVVTPGPETITYPALLTGAWHSPQHSARPVPSVTLKPAILVTCW